MEEYGKGVVAFWFAGSAGTQRPPGVWFRIGSIVSKCIKTYFGTHQPERESRAI